MTIFDQMLLLDLHHYIQFYLHHVCYQTAEILLGTYPKALPLDNENLVMFLKVLKVRIIEVYFTIT